MHRNLGVFTTKNVPLDRLFSQFQGKLNGFTKGRDRSFHFGTKDHNIIGMISHLGPQLAVADGIALANKLKKIIKLLLFLLEMVEQVKEIFKALNVAAVWDLPVIFVIENNGYGLSTPSSEQFRCEKFSDKGIGYGMDAYTIDGNNILEVYSTIKKIKADITKKHKPVILECISFRMRGHEEASGTKYVPKELMKIWSEKDPVKKFEEFLLKEGVLNREIINEINIDLKIEIDKAWKIAEESPEVTYNYQDELNDVFKKYEPHTINPH